MNISKGKVYNVKRKIERSLNNMKMDARHAHKKIPTIKDGDWGVYYEKDKKRWKLTDESGVVCCPMAAVLLDRQPEPVFTVFGKHQSLEKTAAKCLGVKESCVDDFISGFDGDFDNISHKRKYIALGQKFRKKYIK